MQLNQENNDHVLNSTISTASEIKEKPIETDTSLEMEMKGQEKEEVESKEIPIEGKETKPSEENHSLYESDEFNKEKEKKGTYTESESSYQGGRDLSNDPKYQAELKKIYSKDDITRLQAPRKWVIMPNVVGLSEGEALKKLQSLGLVGRVVYEDQGKKKESASYKK